MKKIKIFVGLGITSLLPVLALAQALVTTDAVTLFNSILSILNGIVVPLLIIIAVVVIIFGAFQFVTGAGDPEKRKEGRDKILWGIVGIVVMFSIWGLVNIVLSTFEFDKALPLSPPIGVAIPVV